MRQEDKACIILAGVKYKNGGSMKTTAKQNYGISTIVSRFVVMAALVMATNNVYAQSQNNKPATKCDTLCHTKQKLCTDSIKGKVQQDEPKRDHQDYRHEIEYSEGANGSRKQPLRLVLVCNTD